MHASEAAATAHPGEPAPGMHAAEPAAVHPAEATAAVHSAAAEAATAVTSAATEAAATAAAPESRRCESKRRDHTSNDAITRLLIHPIPPLLQHSRPAGKEISRPNSFGDFK
jgi:hypothetical protein